MRVLIVNDDFFSLKMIECIVRKANINNIETAQNGQEAYELISNQQFDFVLCDLNMPIMNGYVCA